MSCVCIGAHLTPNDSGTGTSHLFENRTSRLKNIRRQGAVLLPQSFWEKWAMTKSKLLGAAGILMAAIATPALAQEAMQEPGAYAQHHPWASDYRYR
jgi:hypothetical protein